MATDIEPETLITNADELQGLTRLYAELTSAIGTAERDHLGYARLTVPIDSAKPAELFLRAVLQSVHDVLTRGA